YPGGDGLERDLEMLEDATVSLVTERRVTRPWGLDGGEPGATGENWLLRNGDEAGAERLGDKCTVELWTGDVVRVLTPGGGGYGAGVVVGGGGGAADVGVGADAGGATRAGAAAAALLATIGGALGAVAAAASSRPWQPTPHDAGRTVATMRWTACAGVRPWAS